MSKMIKPNILLVDLSHQSFVICSTFYAHSVSYDCSFVFVHKLVNQYIIILYTIYY